MRAPLSASKQPRMHGGQIFEACFAFGVIGLVGNEKQLKPGGLQSGKRRQGAGGQMKILRPGRRHPFLGRRIEHMAVDDTVAIDEYSLVSAPTSISSRFA